MRKIQEKFWNSDFNCYFSKTKRGCEILKTIIPSTKISICENNVLAVIGEQKLPVIQGGVVVSFEAHVISSQDYSPFGVTLSGRSWSEGYRYGFQNQETDEEMWDGAINYKYRVEDPRLGRFFSVDPLFSKYPYYSVYQFSGNRLIDCSELEGLEPEKNNEITSSNGDFKNAAALVCCINDQCQSENKRVNGDALSRESGGLALRGSNTNTPVSGAINAKTENGTAYVTDTQYSSAESTNMWVHFNGSFVVDETQAASCANYNMFVTTVLVNNFACGIGPENYVFPTNGIISNSLRESAVVKKALTEFYSSGEKSYQAQVRFGGNELISSTVKYGTITNVEGMLGSCALTITKSDDFIYVNIFNITSLTSGGTSMATPSNVRDPNQQTYFGNISQNFSFTIPLR